MVVGIGIDIVKIEKLKAAIERWGEHFINKVFNPEELNHIAKGKVYYQRLGARFAAKEAVIKALSGKHLLSLKDISILNRENGAPYCKFKKELNLKIFLSITHIEEYAVATAIAQEKSQNA